MKNKTVKGRYSKTRLMNLKDYAISSKDQVSSVV